MSTTFDTIHTHFNVYDMPDYEDISRRFLQGFQSFITAKKYQAVQTVLKQEILHDTTLTQNPSFVTAIVNRMDDESVLEKRYIFISVNPQAMV